MVHLLLYYDRGIPSGWVDGSVARVCRWGNKFYVEFQLVTVKVVVLQCISSAREIYGAVTDLYLKFRLHIIAHRVHFVGGP